MFGYVRYDLPNLYIKDLMLYRAMYCGLCKGIAQSCGQAARLGLTYDVAFLSVLLHNITETDIRIEKQNCFEHRLKRRPIAETDDLTRELGALNTVMVYYKLTDDILDKSRGRSRRVWFKKGYKRARKQYPELVKIVENYMIEQAKTEKRNSDSPDMAADPSAQMMQTLSRHFSKEKANAATDKLFYALGKWVYLIDALDDFENDRKKKNYNPFVLSYDCKTRAELMERYGEDIAFLFDTTFYDMREGLSGVKFYYNRDLTDNVILRGLPAETARVMKGEAPNKLNAEV